MGIVNPRSVALSTEQQVCVQGKENVRLYSLVRLYSSTEVEAVRKSKCVNREVPRDHILTA